METDCIFKLVIFTQQVSSAHLTICSICSNINSLMATVGRVHQLDSLSANTLTQPDYKRAKFVSYANCGVEYCTASFGLPLFYPAPVLQMGYHEHWSGTRSSDNRESAPPLHPHPHPLFHHTHTRSDNLATAPLIISFHLSCDPGVSVLMGVLIKSNS